MAVSNMCSCKQSEHKAKCVHFQMIHSFHPGCYLSVVQLTGMFLPLQAASACCCGESPSGSAPLSTDEWFISHAVNETLCLHTRPTNMFDDSEPRQISHVFQQIIVSTLLPWCEESCPVHGVHTRDRKELPESMHPKMWHVGWLIQWHVLNSPLASKWGLHCTYWGQRSESRNPDL